MRLLSIVVALTLPGCSLLLAAGDDPDSGVDVSVDAAVRLDAAGDDAMRDVVKVIAEIDEGLGVLGDPELLDDELYFTRTFSGEPQIHRSTRIGGPWDAGAPVAELAVGESDPRLTNNGLLLYVTSTPATDERDTFVASREAIGELWSVPQSINLGHVGADYSLSIGAVASRGVITLEASSSSETADLWTIENVAVAPDLTIAPELNSPVFDGNGDLSADGLTLYFASDRNGDRDIFVATREQKESDFATPVALAIVNSSSYDGDPTISADGKTLIFVSARDGARRLYEAELSE